MRRLSALMPLSLRSPLAALPVAATLAFGARATPSAHAAGCDITYTGPAGGAWNVPASWSMNRIPLAAQDVCVPAAAGSVTIPAGTTANAHLVTAGAKLVIPATAVLAVSDTAAADSSAFAALDLAGTLQTAGSSMDLNGDVALSGGIWGPGTAQVRLQAGTLAGSGEIDPSFNAFGGVVQPGGVGAVGTLTFGAVFSEQAGATVVFDLASDSDYDQIKPINNNGWLGGTITAHPLGSYRPAVGTEWDVGNSSPGFSNFGWTVGPAPYFKAQAISHGMKIWLDQALPTVPPPSDGGGTTTTPPATTGDGATRGGDSAPVTSPAPAAQPAAPAPAPVAPAVAASLPAAAQQLLLNCSDRRLVLNDVLEQHGRVALSGTAAQDLVGQRVQILFAGRTAVATATVGPGGVFATTAPLPAAAIKNTNKARYVAVAGSQRSLDLKLQRRLVLAPPRRSGATVTLTGQVTKPLAKPKPQPVTIAQQTACGRWTIVKTFTPNNSGTFTISVPAPAGAAAIYRLQTAVPKTARNPKAYRTFSLPEPVLLTP
jgi:hypothetical protein